MTLFNPDQPTIAPELKAANFILISSNNLYQQMISTYNDLYNRVWANPNATPDLIVAAMGANAVQVFNTSASLATYLNSLGAGVVATMPSGWDYTANADGSVTLTPVTVVGSTT